MQFYTEKDIENYFTKEEMARVDITPIKRGDRDMGVSVDGDPFNFYSADEVAHLITDNKSSYGIFDNGGIATFTTQEEKDGFRF